MRLNSGFSSSPPAAQRFFVLFNSSDNSAAGGTAPDRPSHHPYVFELYETPTLQYFWTEGNRVMHHRDPIFLRPQRNHQNPAPGSPNFTFQRSLGSTYSPRQAQKKFLKKYFFFLEKKFFQKSRMTFSKSFFFLKKSNIF